MDLQLLIRNYRREEITINPTSANIYAVILMMPMMLALGLPYYLLWKENFTAERITVFVAANKQLVTYSAPIIICTMIIGVILHELIHGITWACFAKDGFKSIKFGIIWKVLTPYCHCTEPLTIKNYITGGIMPAVVLGFAPAVIGLVTGHLAFFTFGLFFTTAAAGDFMVIFLLRKEDKNSFVQDHPSKIGCYIFRK
ncbi:DUF3267 domain-containing protein [Fulvivirgaceae bacterium PWU20]|uniref:DUF3267 domain-containing protein n=2 Tax=Chryseosolibacter indicus TaxID=2782351 RepID=A0ABS5VT51_9BACT|nr:DUF3267 domain-containing protein [Chryseosolibacter indicus]